MKNLLLPTLLLATLPMNSAYSEDILAAYKHNKGQTPGIIFGQGGLFDRSFNQASHEGAERYKKQTGIAYDYLEVKKPNQHLMLQGKMAQRGANPVVVFGFEHIKPLKATSVRFPKTQFVIIDAVVNQPNVHSVVFREHEGSFLVGALAAMKSKTGNIGFIGGMDIPIIHKFECGYFQGAKYVKPTIKLLSSMIGSKKDFDSWNVPKKGKKVANDLITQKVDVIYAAAGNTGKGVYKAAKEAKIYAIGVDSNQNYLAPKTMLTSMVKRVDVAVEQAFKTATKTPAGIQSLGLKEGGVDWALDKYNRSLVSPEMEKNVNALRDKIIKGEIIVHDYTKNNQCPL